MTIIFENHGLLNPLTYYIKIYIYKRDCPFVRVLFHAVAPGASLYIGGSRSHPVKRIRCKIAALGTHVVKESHILI